MFLHPNSRLRTTRAATTTHSIIALLRMVTLILGIYWIALFVATHLPAAHVPNMGSDKVQHLIAFAGLGVLLNWAIGLRINRIGTQVGIAWLIAVAYAAIDEWSQQFVVGRTPRCRRRACRRMRCRAGYCDVSVAAHAALSTAPLVPRYSLTNKKMGSGLLISRRALARGCRGWRLGE